MSPGHDRCSLHPQRRAVGICAHCLRERLTCLMQSLDPPEDGPNGEEDAEQEGFIHRRSFDPGKEEQKTRVRSLTKGRSFKNNLQHTMKASAETGTRTLANRKDSLDPTLQKAKHAHRLARSPYQGAIKGASDGAPDRSPLLSNGVAASRHKHASLPGSRRQSNASESDKKTFHGSSAMSGKKNSLLSSPLPQDAGARDVKHLAYKSRSTQVMIHAGRKSASDAIAGPCNKYRQAYMANLEAIAEINSGDTAIKLDQIEGNADANVSWISSLFHRRKGSRVNADTQQCVGGSNTRALSAKTSASIHQSSKVSIDARRLSLDGARPAANSKQITRKTDASKHQIVDCSPSQNCEHARKQCNDRNEAMSTLQKSKAKAIAPVRSSISVGMPAKHVGQASPSPTLLHNNADTATECDDGDADRPLNRGRAWNLTHLSPLQRVKLAPDAHIYTACTLKNVV